MSEKLKLNSTRSKLAFKSSRGKYFIPHIGQARGMSLKLEYIGESEFYQMVYLSYKSAVEIASLDM
jgi:hypothetical protein